MSIPFRLPLATAGVTGVTRPPGPVDARRARGKPLSYPTERPTFPDA